MPRGLGLPFYRLALTVENQYKLYHFLQSSFSFLQQLNSRNCCSTEREKRNFTPSGDKDNPENEEDEENIMIQSKCILCHCMLLERPWKPLTTVMTAWFLQLLIAGHSCRLSPSSNYKTVMTRHTSKHSSTSLTPEKFIVGDKEGRRYSCSEPGMTVAGRNVHFFHVNVIMYQLTSAPFHVKFSTSGAQPKNLAGRSTCTLHIINIYNII